MEVLQPHLPFPKNAPDDLDAEAAFGVFDWRPAADRGGAYGGKNSCSLPSEQFT